MIRRIAVLVKKNFLFNWKVLLVVLTFPIIYYAGAWAEYTFGHIVEEQENFLLGMITVGLSTIPITQSIDKEKGPSTKRFLESLPMRAGELYVANMITAIIYMILLAGLIFLGSWIFGMSCDVQFVLATMPIGILYSTIYIFIYYVMNFQMSQIFLLGSMMSAIALVGRLDVDLNALAFFANPHITVAVCVAMAVLSALIIAILCKTKRRLL